MRKVLVVCTILAALCMVALAGQHSVVAPTKAPVADPKAELQSIKDQILAAKAAGVEPAQELYARLQAFQPATGERRSLDQGGETWATATLIPSLPYNDSGLMGLGDDCPDRPYCDVFYTYTAVAPGLHVFDMCNANATFDGYMKVWQNPTAPCTATTWWTGDDECASMQPRVNVTLAAGDIVVIECGLYSSFGGCTGAQAYVFNVTGPTLAPGRCCYGDIGNPTCGIMLPTECAGIGGVFTAGVTDCISSPCPVPMAGDICATAFPLTVPATVTGTTVGFTNDYDATCPYSGSTSPDVVYSYTPAVDQQVTFDLCASMYDTKLYIYQDACTGTPIACNDDYCPGYRSWIGCQPLLGGHTYFVVVDGYGGASGEYTLTTTECVVVPPPVNDNCANALPIEVNGAQICATTAGATLDCPSLPFPEVWYTFTTTECMDISLSYCGTITGGSLANILIAGECCGTVVYNSGVDYNCPDGLIQIHFSNLAAGTYWLPVAFNPAGDFCVAVVGTACPPPFQCTCTEPLDGRVCNTTGGYAINDYQTVDVPIDVAIQYHITDVNVCFGITHTFDGDLAISLVSPLGTEVSLSNHNGSGGDNFNCTTFDDEATTPISAGTPPYEGAFIPDGALSAFDGENAMGTWFLRVYDWAGGDIGTVDWACVTFTWDYVLAVELANYSAIAGDSKVTLNWATSSETNNDHFEIVRGSELVGRIAGHNGAARTEYTWTDANAQNGTVYSYTLVAVDVNGVRKDLGTVSATPSFNAAAVTEYALHQNFPNPFNPTTSIAVDLVDNGFVSLKVYNLMGQQVADLSGTMTAGRHTISFNAAGLSSGVYMYRLNVNGFSAEKKMLLMK